METVTLYKHSLKECSSGYIDQVDFRTTKLPEIEWNITMIRRSINQDDKEILNVIHQITELQNM